MKRCRLTQVRSILTCSLGIGLIAVLLAGAAFACQGNACGDLRFSVNGNCHTIQNAGSRTVRLQWGQYGPKDLGPGASWTVIVLGQCVGTIVGDITANYSSNSSSGTQPSSSSPHPVTFINQSGITLYIYYHTGTTDCRNYTFGGTFPPQGAANFTVPAGYSEAFIFQKGQDPCPLSTIHWQTVLSGGNPNRQNIGVP